MSDTSTERPANGDQSNVFGVSVRALIVFFSVIGVVACHLIVTLAVVYHAVRSGDFSLVGSLTTISEPYYSVVAVGIGFYLGSKSTPPNPKP
jgi:hypothetical protein